MSEFPAYRFNLPRNVRLFAWLWCGSWLVSAADFLLPHSLWNTNAKSWPHDIPIAVPIAILGFVVAFNCFLFWAAVWRRSNLARWFLLTLFVLPLPLEIGNILNHGFALAQSGLGLAATLAQGVGFIFLFSGDARAWFRQSTRNEPQS
jgi:putative effector of murein hydrolase LrgA (UPF0299 family)